MTPELCPCKRCGRIPIVKKVTDLFYVCCPQERYKNKHGKEVKCDKWQQHEFLGVTEAAAIRNWYWANTKKTLDGEE